nr:MAG: XRE family transcriptional regulator [Bacillota bacterium]
MSRLRELREQKGLSRNQLAKLVGCSREAIRLLERGRRSPRYETARAIAQALGVSPDEIWPPDPKGA